MKLIWVLLLLTATVAFVKAESEEEQIDELAEDATDVIEKLNDDDTDDEISDDEFGELEASPKKGRGKKKCSRAFFRRVLKKHGKVSISYLVPKLLTINCTFFYSTSINENVNH